MNELLERWITTHSIDDGSILAIVTHMSISGRPEAEKLIDLTQASIDASVARMP
jgi:hypothetical protein